MNKYVVILFWVVFVCIILLSIPTMCGQHENFINYYGHFKSYCPSCGWRSRNSCSKCTNCGYCITASGYGECVPGDSSGPYFRSDCLYYEYGSPYEYYPYSHLFPVVKTRSVYPYYGYNKRKPLSWTTSSRGPRINKKLIK